ncbi:N-acetylmuramoyl-L-alanine amidase [Paenibacillus sp.]|uniref:N-acetylmuramoyl-L-alanine amidase n=1 Tax=Paenibacillus sp. TaxID=58172 RepID=UPI0028127854|nr:N-acetylmuramoyl-L-alanine amidase [Paenibacillus sp.]
MNEQLTKPILILDPGHGGKDPGGGSNDMFLEKDKALAISLYQAERFRELGVAATMTRSEDVYLSPKERTRLVRESGAAYCISNHINAGGGDGAEMIHSVRADGTLAKRIGQALSSAGQNVRRVFTRTLQSRPGADYYFMHRDTGAVQTVIVEYGFADSKGDDPAQLAEEWKKFAEAVVEAFCTHVGYPYRPPSPGGADTIELPRIQRRVEIAVVENGVIGQGYLIDGVSYVPARLAARLAGYGVEWDGQRVMLLGRGTSGSGK